MRVYEITEGFREEDPANVKLREIYAKLVNNEGFTILGWKAEMRDYEDSPITGEPAPTLYIYRTKAGTTLRDIDRVIIQPILKDYNVEQTLFDKNYGRSEYRIK